MTSVRGHGAAECCPHLLQCHPSSEEHQGFCSPELTFPAFSHLERSESHALVGGQSAKSVQQGRYLTGAHCRLNQIGECFRWMCVDKPGKGHSGGFGGKDWAAQHGSLKSAHLRRLDFPHLGIRLIGEI